MQHLTETQAFFARYKLEYPAARTAFAKIEETLDTALSQSNTGLLLSLTGYIEGEGYPAFQYIGETRRILQILKIVQLEKKYGFPLFTDTIQSREALWDKYMLSLFSLRRLVFQLSPSSLEDAASFLRENPLSPFAVYLLCTNELLIPSAGLYKTIQEIFQDLWSPEEKLLFERLTAAVPAKNE